jgi:Aerotolerance regulator N-terminal/von Willebrand factor type A domain
MNFLAPLFLLGGLAVALPVIFHLIRRTTRERKSFSSLMFLMPSPPRLTRRSRLEHLLLLLLRCGVLCLLALGFARPYLKKALDIAQPSGTAKRTVLLVDTSASMRRPNLWADARARAESIVRDASPADQIALVAFDRQPHELITFDEWNRTAAGERVALAVRKLAEMSPGWSSTHLGEAIISAAETLADTRGNAVTGPRQIIVISDLQEGSRIEQLQGYEWPKGIEVSVEPIKPRRVSNAGLQLVTDTDDGSTKEATSVRVRIANSADSKLDQFKVGWAGADGRSFAAQPINVYAPAGQSRIVAVPIITNLPASMKPDRIILQGDDEDFDNTVYVIPPEQSRMSVLYLGTESEKDPHQPLYFLQRAFQETRRTAVQVVQGNTNQTWSLAVVTDAISDGAAKSLHDDIATGKTVLCVMKDDRIASTLAQLLGVERLNVREAQVHNYAMLAEIDFRHPLFAPFADPRFSDFTKIHFWKYRKLDTNNLPNARVLAKFDTGDPALLEIPVGKGKIFVLSSGWQPEDSQFALSTKFVPLLYAFLEQSGSVAPPPAQFYVGDNAPLGPNEAGAVVHTPDGSELRLRSDEAIFSQTMTPGIYTLGSQPGRRFAVNLDAAESRTAPMPLDELERLGAPVLHQPTVASREAERKVRLRNTELEERQKLWRWFLLGTLGILLAETWLAGRTARRVPAPEGSTA